jgi:hypothetical protein
MRYVHAEDDPIRAAAETVAARRRSLVGGAPLPPLPQPQPATIHVLPAPTVPAAATTPLGLDDRAYTSRTKLGNYRPYRKRSGPNRAAPPKRAKARKEELEHV